MTKIKKFLPPIIYENDLDLNCLKEKTGSDWHYAVNGKSCIYHILQAYNIKKIMVPVYICNSILHPINDLNIKIVYYDLDIIDLNPSLKSAKELITDDIDAILVASMYGNPADLMFFEKFCYDEKIILIDDAAQSFGAILNGKMVGTFGNTGFFSFSPGKPLAGHLGAYFQLDKEFILRKRTHHCFFHWLKWLEFKYNRLNIYNANRLICLTLTLIIKIVENAINIYYDDICEFEKKKLGGILDYLINGKYNHRKKYIESFSVQLKSNQYFRMITSIRGEPSNHKIVLIMNTHEIAVSFKEHMKTNNIYFINGYKLLANNKELKNACKIDGLVFELPIENNKERMDFLLKNLSEFKC